MSEQVIVKNETTNAVLAEIINGLTKLTDERLLNIKDTLSRMEQTSKSYASKTELEEVTRDFNKTIEGIKKQFDDHNKDDKAAFEVLGKGLRKTQDTIKYGMGALSIIIVVLQIAIPIVLKAFKLG